MKKIILPVLLFLFLFGCVSSDDNSQAPENNKKVEEFSENPRFQNKTNETRINDVYYDTEKNDSLVEVEAMPPRDTTQESEIEKFGGTEQLPDNRLTPPKNYSKTVVVNEPLIIQGNDKMVIENAHYILKNDVVLKDNAQLIITNAFIDHQKDYGGQYSLEAHDKSKVVIENTEIKNACTGTLNWNFFDSSSFKADGVYQKECNIWMLFTNYATASVNKWDWFGGTTCDDASLVVENSKELEIELCNRAGVDMDIELPILIDKYEFSGKTVNGMKNSIILKNATIDGWGVGAYYGDVITVRNGHAVTISFGVGPPYKQKTVILDSINRKQYSDYKWKMDVGQIHLINTTIYGWETSAWAGGHTLIIRNSNFTGPTLNSGDSKVTIENSSIETANSFESVRMTIKDSFVNGDIIAKGDSSIRLYNTKVKGKLIEENNGKIVVKE